MPGFSEKLIDLVLGGVGGVAGALMPEHWRQQAHARLADFNPFEIIKANHDLTRAVRIAWVQAAIAVLEAAQEATSQGADAPDGFFPVAFEALRAIRHDAWDRRGHPGTTAIDVHLEVILRETPGFITPGGASQSTDPLTAGFVETLARISHWPVPEIPVEVGQIAHAGLRQLEDGPPRDFGELVFAAFAELLKDPNKYPQAGTAFAIAQQEATRRLVSETLARTAGIDAKVDQLVARVDAGTLIEASAARYRALRLDIGGIARGQDDAAAAAERRHREVIEAIAAQRGVPLTALQAQLARLGEVRVDADTIPARIESFVTEFLKLKAELARPTNADPGIAGARRRMLAMLEAGDLVGARAMLADELVRVRESRRQVAREEAMLLADRARLDLLEIRYAEAVASYEEAAELVRFDGEAARGYLLECADALIMLGDEFGDSQSFKRAIALLREKALPLAPRTRAALDWAAVQHRLGRALTLLGERDGSVTYLEEALVAFSAAADARPRETEPIAWARSQNGRAAALLHLAQFETGTARQEEAVAALRAALGALTPESAGEDWATAQGNLAAALTRIFRRSGDVARLDESVVAHRAALQVYTREAIPLEWASCQVNLGCTLLDRAMCLEDTRTMAEAAVAFRSSLEELPRERVPIFWAMAKNNLGCALIWLGDQEKNPALLEEAVEALRAALEERRRERVPLEWASTQANIGIALRSLGEYQGDVSKLTESVLIQRAVLEEYRRDRVPSEWAAVQEDLAWSLEALGKATRDTACLDEAVAGYHAAMDEQRRMGKDTALTEARLERALATLSELAQPSAK
ncbi:MAG: tetratricopeptide repeat protein [Alphaproteobacteria bacterium]|nr:tetratricopeptide repeat protein [Alphaproteobacteria bacterium]